MTPIFYIGLITIVVAFIAATVIRKIMRYRYRKAKEQ